MSLLISASDLQRHLNIFFSVQLGILWDVLVPWMIHCYKKRSQIRLLYIKKNRSWLFCKQGPFLYIHYQWKILPKILFKKQNQTLNWVYNVWCFHVYIYICYRHQLPSVSLKLKGADLTCMLCLNFNISVSKPFSRIYFMHADLGLAHKILSNF